MELYIISKWFDNFPSEKKYFQETASSELFPVVDFNSKTIRANRLHSKLLSYGTTFEDKINLIRKYIGALNSRTTPLFKLNRTSVVPCIKITPSMETSKFMHGWYSPDTRNALEGAVQYYKPKVVFELGVWYGQSTVGIFQSAEHKIKYYGFDFFTPTATNPEYVTKTSADKMFIEHPRLESAVSNIASFSKKHDIFFVFEDVMKSPNFSRKHNVIPNLLFIDAIKQEDSLKEIILEFRALNPKIIIVCDDYVFPNVRKALKDFPKKIFGKHAVILGDIPELPKGKSDFSMFPSIKLSQKEKDELPKHLNGYFQ